VIAFNWALSKLILFSLFRAKYGFHVTGQHHLPRRGPCIIAGNHTSFLDPPVLGTACPRRVTFMARADLFHGLLGWYMRNVGVMPIRRGEGDMSAVRAALSVLKRGGVIAIFPEGTRQLDGRLGQAKRGVGLLAIAGQAPIVPALITGSHEALPPGKTSLQPSKIRVAFGPPIPYTYGSIGAASALEALDPRSLGHAGSQPAAAEDTTRRRHELLAAAVTDAWRHLATTTHG